MPQVLWLIIVAAAAIIAAPTCGIQYRSDKPLEYEITSCIFSCLSAIGNGGAIFLSSVSSDAELNYTTFFNCSALGDSSYGGGIYTSVNIFSAFADCGDGCKASTGAMLSTTSIYIVDYLIRSISAVDCAINNIDSMGGTVHARANSLDLSFYNLSDTSKISYGTGASLESISLFTLEYFTLINITSCTSIFQTVHIVDFSVSASNIIRNSANMIMYIEDDRKSTTFSDCVFIGNSLSYLFSMHGRSDVVFSRCWFGNSEEEVISRASNLTFILCSFTQANSLSFSDNIIFSEGILCGIHKPSPSLTPLPKALGLKEIILISIGSVVGATLIGLFVWILIRRSSRNGFEKEVRTIELLRDLEADYG